MFTIPAGVTNLSLAVTNNGSAAFSWLLLTPGGTPTDTGYAYGSRLNNAARNQVNLEHPEFAEGGYGLRVLTPTNATATHNFGVVLTTNRTDMRTAAYPAMKPVVFSATGSFTNSTAEQWHYFQMDVPTNLSSGLRIALNTSNTEIVPGLYVRRDAVPATSSYLRAGTASAFASTIVFHGTEALAGTYFIGVRLPAGNWDTPSYTLTTEHSTAIPLPWDPGATDAGTVAFTNQSMTGGQYLFQVNTETTAHLAWRVALNVTSGSALLYVRYGSYPTTSAFNHSSTRLNAPNGVVISQGPSSGSQFSPGQTWYILVEATPGAQWNLVSGEAYVQPLPPIAADGSSGATATISAEGMRFFSTTVPAGTLAWRLWLNGDTRPLYVRQAAAPHPYQGGTGSSRTYDMTEQGQMLAVPGYLISGVQYFVGVQGTPGEVVTLDSRQQAVQDVTFNSTTPLTVAGYGYRTFRVQVPTEQIGWQINVMPTAGSAHVAVRKDSVPNQWVNDAFSASPASGISPSVVMVPEVLRDGTYYITVHGSTPYTVTLHSSEPVITDIPYTFNITNDAPDRVGWRYYRISDIAGQLGSLGWDLALFNHVPGTQIALRRNALPGEWNSRNAPVNNTGSYATTSRSDYSSTLGFLQRQGHQADYWYIGIYTPASALGSFNLVGKPLTGPEVAFDGTGNTCSITNQPAAKWQYFILTVPAALNGNPVLGWDVRVENPSGGTPQMFVRRDSLPGGTGNSSVGGTQTAWPIGGQWTVEGDWTGRQYDSDGTNRYRQIFQCGMGNPLEPGTYYVGIRNDHASQPTSYTLRSRGIGTGMGIPVTPLAFTGGTVPVTALPPREVAYFSVEVPDDSPSWQAELRNTVGEGLLMAQRGCLPNVSAGNSAQSTSLAGGKKMQKTGDEHYLLMPVSSNTNRVPAGTYYLAVASEGMNPVSNRTGTNTSSFVVTSRGALDVPGLGAVDTTGAADILAAGTNSAGQCRAYAFSVPADTSALEVSLEGHTGSLTMYLRAGDRLSGYPSSTYYGYDNGNGYTWTHATLINIPNPAATNYTLVVYANSGNAADAEYTLRVHAADAQTLTFDGGTAAVTSQPGNTWRFFRIEVPAATSGNPVLGWDMRVENPSGGTPRMFVRRASLPDGTGIPMVSGTQTAWPVGGQWTVGNDWTGRQYDSDGMNRYGQVFQCGMGNPLEPGTYYVGVRNEHASQPASYTLRSRGIGTRMGIPVTPLAFAGDTVPVADLPPREVAYFSVEVPDDSPSWQAELRNTVGEGLLIVQKGCLPCIAAKNDAQSTSLAGGKKMQKTGDEHYLLMPVSSNTNRVPAGTYYLAVAGEGINPASSRTGTNTSSFVVTSRSALDVPALGTVGTTGTADILVAGTNRAGQCRAYAFSMPAGTSALEVSLEGHTGSLTMYLRADDRLSGHTPGAYYYGYDNGNSYTWTHATLINIPNAAATNYTLVVYANSGNAADAEYTLRIHAAGAQTLTFDGGTAAVTSQPGNTWRFFRIEVPAATGGNPVLGWDMRVESPSGGTPQMFVRRASLPDGTSVPAVNGAQTAWPVGRQWTVVDDWTGRQYDSDGTNRYRQIFQCGMGNPLEPGTYYVGVRNDHASQPASYTLRSRGIGTGMGIPVMPLAFAGGTAPVADLPPREVAYFSVEVPDDSPSWQAELRNTIGESLLMVQRGCIPNVAAGNSTQSTSLAGGKKMQKTGDEHYLLMPVSSNTNRVPAGTYYLAVAGEGMNPSSSRIGTNTSSFVVTSCGALDVPDLGAVDITGATDILAAGTNSAGQCRAYAFSVPAGTSALEVSLEGHTGSLTMYLRAGDRLSGHTPGTHYYGYDNGNAYTWTHATFISVLNPAATNYTLVVYANSGNAVDAEYTLRVRQTPTPVLAFDASLGNNIVGGLLENTRSEYYKVTVPETFNGQPVLGWKLRVEQILGSASVRVRKDILPDSSATTTPFCTGESVIVPDYLTPGTWYAEVRGTGVITDYTLSSSALLLTRPAWVMPVAGGAVATPGLPPDGALFADSGVDAQGSALPGDQGTDLAAESFDYYTITVPQGNAGLMRMMLNAINGSPHLYVRAGKVPSMSHYANGSNSSNMYDRSMATSATGSLYANWVPANGRFEKGLAPGTWHVAVYSGKGSVRYRLTMDTGNVKTLTLDGGGFTGPQSMAAGDFVYYAVEIPVDAPVNWNINYAVSLGSVTCYIRDRVPPGQGAALTSYIHWNSGENDRKNYKNSNPYPAPYTSPGSYTVKCPPLRPGNTYYIGFRAVSDSTLSVNCTTNGGTIGFTALPFHNGDVSGVLPAYGAVKYRMDVPDGATNLTFAATNQSSGVAVYLEQGSVPTRTTGDHRYWTTTANIAFNQSLTNPTTWPWQPGYSYFMVMTNTTATAQTFSLYTRGKGGEVFADPFYFTDIICDDASGKVYLYAKVNPGQTYTLMVSADLETWAETETFTPSADVWVIEYPFTEDRRFFRLEH